MTFNLDIFPGLSRTLSFNFQDFSRIKVIFQDFPGPGILKKKSRTFQEAWEPCRCSNTEVGGERTGTVLLTYQINTEEVEDTSGVGLVKNLSQTAACQRQHRLRRALQRVAGETVERRTSCRVPHEAASTTASHRLCQRVRGYTRQPITIVHNYISFRSVL